MEAAAVDWSMGSRAAVLVDWGTAAETGRRLGGQGPRTPAVERARLREELAELVPLSESLIGEFTGLRTNGYRARPWVMSRGEWVGANLRALQRLLEPLAGKLVPEGARRSELRRKALGAQIGVLLGYVSRKVLGQYDVFLPPDDEGMLYFVGPNVIEAERRFALPPRDFRLWIAIHEVTHRVQFGATPWLKPYLARQIDALSRHGPGRLARADVAAEARRRRDPRRRRLARSERHPPADERRAARAVREDAGPDVAARGPRVLRDEPGRRGAGARIWTGCDEP